MASKRRYIVQPSPVKLRKLMAAKGQQVAMPTGLPPEVQEEYRRLIGEAEASNSDAAALLRSLKSQGEQIISQLKAKADAQQKD